MGDKDNRPMSIKTNIKIKIVKFKKSKFLLAVVMLAIGISFTVCYYEGKQLKDIWTINIVAEAESNPAQVSQDVASVVASHNAKGEVSSPNIAENYIPELKKVFGDEWKIAYAVMMAESRGDKSRIGDKHLMFSDKGEMVGDSVGLFQIRTAGRENGVRWSRCKKISCKELRKKLLDPNYNIQYAKKIADWNKWTTFRNNQYLKFM